MVKKIIQSLYKEGITQQQILEALCADRWVPQAVVFSKLEKEGINFNQLTSRGTTVLMEAMLEDMPGRFEYLLSLPSVKMTARSAQGQTLFDLFESRGKDRLPLDKARDLMGMLEDLLGKITPSLTAQEKTEVNVKQRYVPYEQRRRMVVLYNKLKKEVEEDEDSDGDGEIITITDPVYFQALYSADRDASF